MLRVGLTGGIASGKSEVARRLAAAGAVLIDADVLAREVVAPGTPGLATVVAAFGPDVLGADGALDRPRLGGLVFGDEAARRRLEGIVHPLVRERAAALAAAAAAAAPDAVVVEDIPLLVESGQAERFDVVVVVDVPEAVQVDRLTRHRGLDEAAARGRIAAQASRTDRLNAADVVIDNTGTVADLDAHVAELWSDLTARASRSGPAPK